jgi:hypothetical protein
MAAATETAQFFPTTRAPLPLDPLSQRLCATFLYPWQPIVGLNDPAPEWQTITKYPLRPRVLWELWQDPTQLVGVRFGSQTSYALLDIDRDSPHHPAQNPNALPTLRLALETIGIYRTVLIRSSSSEGLHLYIPLPIAVPTFGLACALKQCLEAQGFTLTAGQLESFPNCKAYAKPGSFIEYTAHRLPLQPASGSILLNDDGHPVSQDLSRFFAAWDTAAAGQVMEELHSAIGTARSNRRTRRRQSRIVEDWRNDLRLEIDTGWTAPGQTNHLLKTIACYGVVFEGLQGDALATYVQDIAINAPGYRQWCGHRHEISLRSQVWANAAAGYYWKLGDPPKRGLGSGAANEIVPFSGNAAKSADAQRRIKAVVEQLKASDQLPARATARAHAIITNGISSRTLYRHLELWHPQHLEGESELCKIPLLAGDRAILAPPISNPAKSPEPLQSQEFYTKAHNMKCDGLPLGFLQFLLTFLGLFRESLSIDVLESPVDFPNSRSFVETDVVLFEDVSVVRSDQSLDQQLELVCASSIFSDAGG